MAYSDSTFIPHDTDGTGYDTPTSLPRHSDYILTTPPSMLGAKAPEREAIERATLQTTFRRHTDGTSDYIGCEAPESDSDSITGG